MAGVVPGRWSNLLLSDRDEGNETVGTARGVFFFPLLAWCFLLVANRGNTPHHRAIVHEEVPKANSSTNCTHLSAVLPRL